MDALGLIRLVDHKSRWACRDLEQQIRRHCDGVGEVRIEPKVAQEVCEHCLTTWQGCDEVYNNGCCDKDELNNPMPLLRAVG